MPAAVYHEGWAQNGAIVDPHKVENIELHLRYQGTEAGPLFWAQYSFLGLDPIGLKDEYCANYFDEMRNLTLVNRGYCVRNPKHYKGFGPDCWGLTTLPTNATTRESSLQLPPCHPSSIPRNSRCR